MSSNSPQLMKVDPPTRGPSESERDKMITALKARLKVGMRVEVENGLHEITVKVVVAEINEQGFKIMHLGRLTESLWTDAHMVVIGKRLVLFDGVHCYTHIV